MTGHIPHSGLITRFKTMFPALGDKVLNYKDIPREKGIKITLTSKLELIFMYRNPDDWSIDTKKAFEYNSSERTK